MRFLPAACMFFIALAVLAIEPSLAKKSSRSASTVPNRASSRKISKKVPRRDYYDDDDEEEEEEEDDDEDDILDDFDDGFDEEEDDDDDDDYEEIPPPKKRKSSSSRERQPPPRAQQSGRRKPRPRYDEEDFENDYEDPPTRRGTSTKRRRVVDDYDEPPRRYGGRSSRGRSSRRGPPPRRGRGHVVPYTNKPSTFTRGLEALRESLPDPNSVREAALSSISVARETTSRLSTNLYRDIKGLTSSELEQVMLKATRPDDESVQGRHVERLVRVTHDISSRYDIYDAVLRKLWAKIAEKDWRTKMKALYILHRFSADGASQHRAALKARLRELRRTNDPKRKDKYFNSRQLLSGDSTPANMKFRAFMSRYAHYVLLRAQCFGGKFDEIAIEPKSSKKSGKVKPMTSTCLRKENLDAAKIVLKAGAACFLKEGEDCELTAVAVERVVNDLISLSDAVTGTLNKVLKSDSSINGANPELLKQWCEFYSEDLLPKTRAMMKKTTKKLDAYELYLPSRIGTTVSQEVLQRGLNPSASDQGASEDGTQPPEANGAPGPNRSEEHHEGLEANEEQNGEGAEQEEENEAQDREPSKKLMSAVEQKEEDDDLDEYDYEEEYYDDEEEE